MLFGICQQSFNLIYDVNFLPPFLTGGCCFRKTGMEHMPVASWREEMNAMTLEFPSICLRAMLKGYSTCGVENQVRVVMMFVVWFDVLYGRNFVNNRHIGICTLVVVCWLSISSLHFLTCRCSGRALLRQLLVGGLPARGAHPRAAHPLRRLGGGVLRAQGEWDRVMFVVAVFCSNCLELVLRWV